MPTIDVAMARSVPREMLARVSRRGIAETANNVKTSFSSWDGCMAATYCKWPVIAAIIVGGLIVISVVWCIIRCACCGLSCCCGCFSCLKCCGNCCGCCDSPNKKHKHLDEPYFPPAFAPNSGYQPTDGMKSGVTSSPFSPPQYARFETGPNGMAVDPKPVNDDALPPMPSWDTAAKRRISVEDEPGAVELGELDPVTGQRMPLMSGGAGGGSISRTGSPAIGTASAGASPYGHPNGSPNGFMSPNPNGGRPNDQFARNNSQNSRTGFGDQGLSPVGPPPGQAYGGQHGGYAPPPHQNQFGGQQQPIGGAYSDDFHDPHHGAAPYPDSAPYPNDSSPQQGGVYGVIPTPGFGQHQRSESGQQRPFTGDRALVPAGPLGGGGYSGNEEAYAPRMGSPPILSNTSGYGPRMGSPPLQGGGGGGGGGGGYRGVNAPHRGESPQGGFRGMPPQRVDSPQGGYRGATQGGFGGPPQQRMGSPPGPERRGSPGPGPGGFGPPRRVGTGSTAPPSYASRSPNGGRGGGGGGGYGGERW